MSCPLWSVQNHKLFSKKDGGNHCKSTNQRWWWQEESREVTVFSVCFVCIWGHGFWLRVAWKVWFRDNTNILTDSCVPLSSFLHNRETKVRVYFYFPKGGNDKHSSPSLELSKLLALGQENQNSSFSSDIVLDWWEGNSSLWQHKQYQKMSELNSLYEPGSQSDIFHFH